MSLSKTLCPLLRTSSTQNIKIADWDVKHAGGGGGTLIFSAYVGSDPASALHPKKGLKIHRNDL